MSGDYKIPDHIHLSEDCQHLLSRMFIPDPSMVFFYMTNLYVCVLILISSTQLVILVHFVLILFDDIF